jgi:hypothetical protein
MPEHIVVIGLGVLGVLTLIGGVIWSEMRNAEEDPEDLQ